MVYCSHCGVQNRDGSKFCSNCGARLVAEQGLRCPMCSTSNQVENVFCSNCGARLVPLVAAPPVEPKAPPAPPIKGLSLPAKPATGTEAPKPETKIEPTPQPQPKVEEVPKPAPVEPIAPEPTAKIPVAQESPKIEQGEIPDWIANLRSLPPAESVEDDGIAVEEIPDWLKPSSTEVAPQAVASVSEPEPEQKLEPEPEPIPAPEPEPESVKPPVPKMKIEVPDWLSQISTPIKPIEPGAEPIKSDELPDWLKQATTDFAPAPSTPSIPHDELPDWLRPETPTPTQEPEPTVTREPEFVEPVFDESIQVPSISDQAVTLETTGVETPSEAGEIPDWLRDAVAAQPQESTAPTLTPETELPIEAPAPSEIPAWVAALKPKDADVIAPSFGAEKSEETIEVGEIPPWLAELKPKEAEPIHPSVPAQPQAPAPAEGELPAWVMALKPKEAEQIPTQPTQEEPVGEMPAWVAALKPKEISEEPQALELGAPPSQGATILSDLPGVLPLATALAQPHPKPQRFVPTERHEGALVFESLLASTAEPVVAQAPAKQVRKRTMRPLIYVLLLLAVLVPFIVPMDSVIPITQVPAENLFDLINALPANAPVVVSFDYDPGTAGEMDLLAKAVVRHLVQRGAKILAVSTIDTGPQMAQHIMTAIEQENGKIKYGSDYAIMYLPSNEVSLSQLATSDLPTKDYKNNSVDVFFKSANLKSLRDAAVIIEIAGRDDRLKMWMEQVQPRANVKMAAAVSAAVEPKARAYRGSNQLVALTSGLLGAAQYEALTRQSGQAVIAANSQSIAQIALIFIIVLGNIVQLISRGRGQAT